MNLGLTLGGGGVLCGAELGVAQALYENNIKPTIFAGTSAGAMTAAILADGYSPEEALKKFKSVGEKIVNVSFFYMVECYIRDMPIQGISDGKNVDYILADFFGDKRMTDIACKLGVVTTDLIDGSEVVFSNDQGDKSKIRDPRAKWVVDNDAKLDFVTAASGSIPGIFVPKTYKDCLLVDGGVSNNVPSDVAVALGADKVISIELGSLGIVGRNMNVFEVLKRSLQILEARAADNSADDTTILLSPDLSGLNYLDFRNLDICYNRGYQYAKTKIDEVKNQLEGE